ncbi:MAG: flagellar hook-basal body complex protein FliE [Alphaproteobacteria bacterium]|nr:flagellar hook-basal body complex protein FliE [Alphaproteobacteria bacterium]
MAAIPSAAISAYLQAARVGSGASEAASGVAQTGGANFADLLSGVMNDAATTGRAAELQANGALQGKGNLVDVVTAVQAAEVSLETVVAIRDKVIAAYQEIMRMPI